MRFLFCEFRRIFFSSYFFTGVIGVAAAQFLSIYKVVGINTSVYTTYICAVYFIPYLMSFMFCALPYAQSFCEDIEHSYIRQIIMRKELRSYTALRVILIYLSAVVTMVLVTLIFVALIRLKVPWIRVDDAIGRDILAQIFINSGNYILYFFVHSIYSGILAAFLVLLAVYASLFWKNKLWILSMPFMVYCLLTYYLRRVFENIPQLDISVMFNPAYNVWNNALISIVWPIGISIILTVIIGRRIYLKLGRMCNG